MRFETGILLGNPGAVRLFKLCFALPRCLALRSRLQRFKLLGGHDDGVNAPIFFNVDRLCFGLGAVAPNRFLAWVAVTRMAWLQRWIVGHFSQSSRALPRACLQIEVIGRPKYFNHYP